MKYERLKAIKPLTQPMIQLLTECYNNNMNIACDLNLYDQSTVKGLIDRELIEQKPILKDNKRPINYILTETGKLYLTHYFKK